jgi:hypothetical protein
MFLNFYLEFLKSSEPLKTKVPPISSFFGRRLVLYRILSSYSLAYFILDEKILQSAAQPVFRTLWETPNLAANIKCIVPAFFGDQFLEKDGVLGTHHRVHIFLEMKQG